MVVLDQCGVAQPEPVVDAAPDANRVFLQSAQAGQRFAGVADFRLGAAHGIDPGRRRGGDSGQVADQVQHGAFGRQQPAGFGLQRQQRRTRLQPGAVLDAVQHPISAGAEDLVEHQERDVHPGDHAGLPGHQRCGGRRVGGHRRQSGDVRAVPKVLGEADSDGDPGRGQLAVGQRHQQTAASAPTPTAFSSSETRTRMLRG